MFSVGNINTLHYLYLECADRVDNVQDINKEQLKGKYGAYYHRLFQQINDVFNTSRWIHDRRVRAGQTLRGSVYELVLRVTAVVVPFGGVIEGLHHVAEAAHMFEVLGHLGLEIGHFAHDDGIQMAVQNIHGDELTRFVKLIAANLTYRFHHEISLLPVGDSYELTKRHCEQVEACLKNCARDDEEYTTVTLLTKILNFVDPEPKNEIENRIKAYIERRDGRVFRSQNYSREEFLIDFNCALKNNETPLITLISQLSSRVFFNDDKQIWKSVQIKNLTQECGSLSVENPFLTNGNYRRLTPLPVGNQIPSKIFNNPFATAVTHHALRQVSRDIMMLLIRLQIKQSINEPSGHKWEKRSVKIINIIAEPELRIQLTKRVFEEATAARIVADAAAAAAAEDNDDAADELASAKEAVKTASRILKNARLPGTQAAAARRLGAAKAALVIARKEAKIDAAIAAKAADKAAAKAEEEREALEDWVAAKAQPIGLLQV